MIVRPKTTDGRGRRQASEKKIDDDVGKGRQMKKTKTKNRVKSST